jgi:hypothetical protein
MKKLSLLVALTLCLSFSAYADQCVDDGHVGCPGITAPPVKDGHVGCPGLTQLAESLIQSLLSLS